MENRVKGYSLWLVPEGEARKVLEALILKLSSALGTPSFLPHVTLLGQLTEDEEEIVEKTAQLASSIERFPVSLSGTGYLDEYFRCLFLVAGESPGLMTANLKARSLFGRMDGPLFMPHLSLVYGNMSVEAKKDIVAEMIGHRDCSFQIRKISLFSTKGSPHEWYPVEDFPVG